MPWERFSARLNPSQATVLDTVGHITMIVVASLETQRDEHKPLSIFSKFYVSAKIR